MVVELMFIGQKHVTSFSTLLKHYVSTIWTYADSANNMLSIIIDTFQTSSKTAPNAFNVAIVASVKPVTAVIFMPS